MKCNQSLIFMIFSITILVIFSILIILEWSDTLSTNFDFNCDKKQLDNFLIILFTVISILIIHFFFLNRNIQSQNLLSKYTTKLYQNYRKSPLITLIWRLSHFIMAFLGGVFAPCYWKEMIWIQTIWELIECSNITQTFLKKIWKFPQKSCLTSCGLWGDMIANFSGIIIGLIFRNIFF